MTTLEHQLASGLAGRYHLERELGQGGMAVVFLAQDLRHDRKVALKVLRPDLSVVLLESRRKKVSFLRLAIGELGLAGAEAWEGRGEEPGERAGTFDLVASRGVATDAGTLGAYAALLRPGGSLLLFKGPETAASATALLRAGRFPNVREHVTLLGEGKRRIHLAAKLEY